MNVTIVDAVLTPKLEEFIIEFFGRAKKLRADSLQLRSAVECARSFATEPETAAAPAGAPVPTEQEKTKVAYQRLYKLLEKEA